MDTQPTLQALCHALRGARLDDKNAIAELGVAAECLLPAGDELSRQTLLGVLGVLQKAYLGALPDLQAAGALLVSAGDSLEALLASPADDQAQAAARSVLSQMTALASEPSTATDQTAPAQPTSNPAPEQTAPAEAPSVDEEAPAATGSAVETYCLDDLAARLVSLTAGDADDLATLRTQLQAAAAASSDDVAEALTAAAACIEQAAIEGDDALAKAAGALEQAMKAARRRELLPSAANEPQPVAEPDAPDISQDSTTLGNTIAQSIAAPGTVATATPAAILPLDCDMDLLGEYVAECLDHIATAEGALLSLESSPEDMDLVNAVFRAFHTIKGTSGMLGISPVQSLAHLAENLLDKARSNQLRLMGGYADLALKSIDHLKSMIEGLKGLAAGEPIDIPSTYDGLMEQLRDPAAAGISEEGARESLRIGDILVGRDAASRDAVEQAAIEGGPLGEKLIAKGEASVVDVAKALRTQKQTATASDNTVRIATGRLDSLIDMVGEIVIAHSMVAQDRGVAANDRLQRNVAHTGKIIRELQDLTMSLRMVPLKATFQKMARLVRDLGRKNGKDIEFVSSGDDTEIDRNMVEVLNDPLVHMIRNAVDHGVEDAATRRAAGKSPTGTVSLRAYQSAGNVVLELADDGKGLDKTKIVAKAIQRGVIASAGDLSESEIFNLIFLPGFSTADKVTDVSGRGVGMDVVKRNVEAIRGRVELTSQLGAGTLFTLRLPLTMAITDAMLVRVGSQRYLLPTISILQSFRPEAGAVKTVTARGEMIMLRDELMPVFRLHQIFGIADAVRQPHEGLLIVIQAGGHSAALMVDELLGQ